MRGINTAIECVVICLLLLLAGAVGMAQTNVVNNDTTICIKTLAPSESYGGFLWWGKKIDIRVEWQVMYRDSVIITESFRTFKVAYSYGDDKSRVVDTLMVDGLADFGSVEGLPANKPCLFTVIGVYIDGRRTVISRSRMFDMSDRDTYDDNANKDDDIDLGFGAFFEHTGDAFRKSSKLSKAAFIVIWLFVLAGLVAWLRKTSKVIRATKVFPKKSDLRPFLDKLKKDTETILEDADNYDLLRKILEERATVERFQGNSSFIKRIARLLEKVFQIFHGNDMSDTKEYEAPTFYILRAGLLSLKLGCDETREVLESRSGTEMENLRKCSYIDLLWGMGVTAPLLGLFGTVTGLSYSFFGIYSSSMSNDMIQKLSGGINEALFTTIWGLVVGILAMMSYYYYNYKLERAYSVWQSMIADFLDSFCYKIIIPDVGNKGDHNAQ